MRHVRPVLAVLCTTALLIAATAGLATAQDNFNRTTRITFSAPVELPTKTLPAGTYLFRLSDSKNDRHIVQVFDEDGEELVTTLFAMPTHRAERSDETVITFRETAANMPPPIRFWYYPSDLMGQEFAYPRERALEIAQATGESVLAIDGDRIVRVEPTPIPAPTPTPIPTPTEPPPVTPPITTVEPTPVPETEPMGTSGRLPQTASELPLVGLIGLLALGGALLLRAFRRSAA